MHMDLYASVFLFFKSCAIKENPLENGNADTWCEIMMTNRVKEEENPLEERM